VLLNKETDRSLLLSPARFCNQRETAEFQTTSSQQCLSGFHVLQISNVVVVLNDFCQDILELEFLRIWQN